MTVYVLFHETNTGHSDASDGYIDGIYETEAIAEQARLNAIRLAVSQGRDVYWNPDTEEEGPGDWTDDWHVEAHEMLTAPQTAFPWSPDDAAADGVSGQDRESYSDSQDRRSYWIDKEDDDGQ